MQIASASSWGERLMNVPFRRFRSRRAFGSSGIRRKPAHWIQVSNDLAPSATTFAFDLLAAYRARVGITAGPVGTIVRTRGTIQSLSSACAATGVVEDQGYYAGILKESRTIAAANVPTPFSVPYADWMYREFIPLISPGTTYQRVLAANTFMLSHPIDVKAKRKLEDVDETLWFCLEATDSSAALMIFTHFVCLSLYMTHTGI